MNSNLSNTAKTAHARTDRAARVAHDLIDRAAETLGTSEQKLRYTAHDTEQRVRETLQSARARSQAASQSASSLLARHPRTSIGLALGAGVLLALWMRGRDSGRVESVLPKETH